MNTKDDSFLTSLLQYHTRLIDQQFVDDIINKIKAKSKYRLKIMIVSFFSASLIAIPLLVSIDGKFTYGDILSSLSPYIITFFLLTIIGFGAWLTSEDF